MGEGGSPLLPVARSALVRSARVHFSSIPCTASHLHISARRLVFRRNSAFPLSCKPVSGHVVPPAEPLNANQRRHVDKGGISSLITQSHPIPQI